MKEKHKNMQRCFGKWNARLCKQAFRFLKQPTKTPGQNTLGKVPSNYPKKKAEHIFSLHL